MRKLRQSLLLSLAALCVGLIGVPSAAAQPLKLGVYEPGSPASSSVLSQYSSRVGGQPRIVMWYRDFGLPLFYSNERATLEASGATPMVSWEPFDGDTPIRLSQIATGAYDQEIISAAQLARTWEGEFMVRFAHEMNLPSIPWGPGRPGAGPTNYINAWRRIVGLFRSQGADNVRFVWAPNIDYGGRPFSAYFPGDAWVDYTALDGYNFGTSNPGEVWQTMRQVFEPSYRTLTELSQRPVLITETASSEIGGDKAAWIRTGFLRDIPGCMPRVEGVIWYDKDLEADWRIDTSGASLEAYRDVVASSVYGGPEPYTGPTGCDRTPPEIRSLKVTKRIAEQRRRGRIAYSVSEASTVTIELRRRTGGRFKRVARLRRRARAGANRVQFSRSFGSRHLGEGGYRVTVRAVDRSGNRSRARRARFRVG
jgi:hypothetical protein